MKLIKFSSLVLVLTFLVSCSSVRVTSDYDTTTDFSKYKTFAFYKKGIDKAEISNLDKRRILKAVEKEMESRGFVKSKSPDVLVNIFTKSRQKVDIHNNNHMYFGWRPWYYGPDYGVHISKYTEGTLFIDLIDAKQKELVWQGIGSGALRTSHDVAKKEERIREFVAEIMMAYPPVIVEK